MQQTRATHTKNVIIESLSHEIITNFDTYELENIMDVHNCAQFKLFTNKKSVLFTILTYKNTVSIRCNVCQNDAQASYEYMEFSILDDFSDQIKNLISKILTSIN
jgi:hypothetical protein